MTDSYARHRTNTTGQLRPLVDRLSSAAVDRRETRITRRTFTRETTIKPSTVIRFKKMPSAFVAFKFWQGLRRSLGLGR